MAIDPGDNKHYTRSDGTRHVILGDPSDPEHGHIIYNQEGDVIYIRAEGNAHDSPNYDVNKGDNVDDPSWPNQP